ncbi:MAG: phosphomannomutase/phosphoglucomutase [Acidimicrobiales bacterium]|nr:phosphomannomutase/phosphoglucomutase [Acidimicrobiales bacterium]
MTATRTIYKPVEDAIWPPESARPRWERLKDKATPEVLVTFAVVLGCVIFTFKFLQPSQLFNDTTPAGGDMGAHVWLPDFVKRGLLPHLRVTGWTPDWYDGFPALTYYFPLPIWAIALLSYVIPYNIAFKLVTVLGLLALPVAAWALGRLARIPFPGPAGLAAATLLFLFSRDFTIYGGNIASTMAGEFSFSISLAFALLFLGLVAGGLQTGKHRVPAAITLACCGFSHILPLIFAVAGAVVLVIMSLAEHRDRRRLRWAFPVLLTGGALIAFWALPFWLRLPYATNMGYQKVTNYWSSMSHHDTWLITLAVLGFVLSAARFNRIGIFLGIMAGLAATAFRFAPPARLWNARALPFWFLCLYLLAGVALIEVGSIVVEAYAVRKDADRWGRVGVIVVTTLAAAGWVLYPLRELPGGHTTAGRYDWLGITSADHSFVPDWVYWNYSGYENVDKARHVEYFALVNEMKKLGSDPTDGCGRAMWQYEPDLNQMGTPDALMLLPYWTHGCIGSQEGLYYESSATTPYHFLNAAELSEQPANPVRGLLYPATPDVAEGVQHLQMLGVKYFMAETPAIEAQADSDSNLLLVGTVGPFSVNYTSSGSGSSTGVQQRTWKIYKVLDSDLVTPLINQPVVMKGVASRDPSVWLQASESWYLDPNRWNTYEAAAGPKSWARVSATQKNLPQTPEPAVQVSNVKQTNESVFFDVDQIGVPVLVKVSYFPNWQVSGGTGPYRVTPNLMVVIPTSNHVALHYGYTPVDWAGFIISLLGLGSLVLLWRAGPVAYRAARRPSGRAITWTLPGEENGKVSGGMASSTLAQLDEIFKAYDIRGLVPNQLNADVARAAGTAFARYCGEPRVIVGRDMRPSGAELVHAFAEGVTAEGVDVVDIGLCSTDEMYFASGSMNAPGAMFTASHNPAQYNGIKLCHSGARPIGAETGLAEIKASVAAALASGVRVPPVVEGNTARADILADFAAKVRSFVDVRALRPLKVVADTANGMGGLVVPVVFEGLPFRLEVLFGELDGTFPNHPADPIQPENLVALQERIRATGADVGLAFDGDADRCFLVDDQGVPLSGSTTTALVAAAMLERHPGATILYNLICSKAVPEIIGERGGVAVRTRVGHSYIKAVMADTDALFGGEHSGHYYFRDNYRADSGSIAALVVLEVLSRAGRPLSEIRRDFERYAASGEINTQVDDPLAVIEEVASHYYGVAQDRLDGLTVDMGDWWFNLRPSNTEPLLRLNLEAADPATCQARTAEVLALITGSERH